MDTERVLDGRFELECLVRRGGMGEIHRALDRSTGQRAAIKLLIGMEEHLRARFEREVRTLAALEHPTIVRYLGRGLTAQGVPYLAMEWLEGEDLRARLERQPLTLGESIELGFRVATALAEAHRRGVIHRDLKPSNLFLSAGRPEEVKILDFGVAYESARTALTEPGDMVGTPGYMAPEQVQGMEQPTPAADVFALGCVLYECLAGEAAFTGEHSMARLARILFVHPPSLAARRPGLPAELDALVARMMAKKPAERPADGAAVAAALAPWRARGSEGIFAATPDPAAMAGQRGMSPPGEPALSERERRLMAVLLAGADPGCAESAAANDEETRPARARTGVARSAWQPAREPVREPVQEQIRADGGQFEELIDGASAIQRPQGEVAPDPAARAARAALSLQPLLEHRSMALALGQIEGQAPLLLGEMLERAAHLLAHPAASTGVITDELTAALFDAQPEVEAREGALVYKRAPEAVLPAERRLLGKRIDCVGRERELGMLQGLFEACVAEGHAGAVVITAPPGMGKSRLVHELVQRLRGRGREMAVWIGRGDALRAGSPLGLLRDALQGACGIREGDPPETRRARLGERVAAHVATPERERVSERLGELLGLPAAGEDSALRGAARQDARILGEPLRAAWLDLLRAESAAHPVLLVLEDLHWGDLPTVRLVEAALCALGERPWMVLGLGRPELLERFPRLWAGQGAQHIALGPLSRRASMALVRRALGAELADETAERLAVRSGGQAFFLEELIRAAARGEPAALPEMVMALVQARLGALPAEERHVLRAASVLGEVFWQGGVTTLLEGAMTVAEVEALLVRLEERELVVRHAESRLAGEVEFAFRHAFVREEAYALLEAEELAAGHRQAACFLERMGERDPLLLARHWERGGVPARAAEHHVVARERALACGDPPDPALTPG